MRSRNFLGYLVIVFIFVLGNPCVLIARDLVNEYDGRYANELNGKIYKTKARIAKNLKKYRKDKSVVHLDQSYNLIIQTTSDIHDYLRNATQQVQNIPDGNNYQKLEAQVDKLEIINIRDIELPYLCEKLYEVGNLYVRTDKQKASKCFSVIAEKFTSYESESCNKNARSALKRLNRVKR